MNRKNLKFILAPFGVAAGITIFIFLGIVIAGKMNIPQLSKLIYFVPRLALISIGLLMMLLFLPLFISGIYFLNRRGAVGQSDTLRTNGIYRYVRNPMYTGISITIAGIGFILLNTGVVIGGILWLCITFIQCKREESELAVRFGKEYEEYRKNTPMLFPDFFHILNRK
jgi:protein-S-isoprenylcysteine O-methyltransferase Ste14